MRVGSGEAGGTCSGGAVLGAYLGLTEPTEPYGPDNPHLVMASGNGEVWAVDTGRDL